MKRLCMFVCMLGIVFSLSACMNFNNFTGIAQIEFKSISGEVYYKVEVESGYLIDKPQDPTYLDYEFKGWFKDKMFLNAWNFETDKVENHTTLYAKFVTSITHTVSKQNGTNSLNEPTYQRVVETIEVRVEPKVVVSFSLDIADIFKNVGLDKTQISVFGMPKSNLPESLNEFADAIYPNTGTLFVPNYDVIDLMIPDLIIIGGRSASLYDTLKVKYPNADVIDVSNTNFNFEVQNQVFDNLGKVFPKIKTDLIMYQSNFAQSVLEIKQKSNGIDALFLLVNDDNISVFGSGSRYGVIYNEFGFTSSDPDAVTLDSHGNIVSFEYVSAINPSVIFLLDRSQALGSSGAIDLIKNNQLIKNTKAGQANDIYVLDANSWYILPGGISSTIQMIEDINQVFS